jgi:precorrin-8X/cobalt-precorrin-8 methylmutase
MEIIGKELAQRGVTLPAETQAVVKRVIHTTADFDYVDNLRFTDRAVELGVEALRAGAVIVTDTNMAKAGVSKGGLAKLNGQVCCFMADPQVAAQAKERGTTRAVAAMEKAAADYPGAILAVGNAPTALLELCRLIREGLRPALVIGVPVGFVNVVESKQQALETCQAYGVPCIAALGRKGGSNVAAAICNALIYTALDVLDPAQRI